MRSEMPGTEKPVTDIGLWDIEKFRAPNGPKPSSGIKSETLTPSDAVRNFRVALVTMPFARATHPALLTGYMKAILRQAGFPVDDYYLNLDLAAQIGFEAYYGLIDEAYRGVSGEWLASFAAYGEEVRSKDLLASFPDEAKRMIGLSGKVPSEIHDVRERVIPAFIDDCVHRIAWGSYDVVAFDVTFQQIAASLALARDIKQQWPHITTILYGSKVEGEIGIELMRVFPYVDYAAGGDLGEAFPELLRRLAEHRDPKDLLGVVTRAGNCLSYDGPAVDTGDIDQAPTADYDTFFEMARRYDLDTYADSISSKERKFLEFGIPILGSRGCWWGEKSHCTFCSCSGANMTYRSKSPGRMLAELEELSSRYGRKDFTAYDLILDMKHIQGVFGSNASQGSGYRFYTCLKSNLTRDQVRTLAQGGLAVSVVGIESLSTKILKSMRKGAAKLQNVNTLRWGTYYRVMFVWNLLRGFPGESLEDVADEMETLRLINHLQPPHNVDRIRLERFSPNFSDEGLFPTKWRRPYRAYSYIYPSYLNLEEVAFQFDYETDDSVLADDARREQFEFVEKWQKAWGHSPRAALTYQRTESDVLICDTRFGLGQPKSYTLLGLDADIYEAFSPAPRTPAQVSAALELECPRQRPDEDSIAAACETFCEAGLMISEAGRYLSLALPAEPECSQSGTE